MKKLKLAFLWHMHQPYYKDDLNDKYVMPWVFLHAIKDYYEMPYFAQICGAKVTFNLVPSLMLQLKEYENFSVNDTLLTLIKKDVLVLDEKDRVLLAKRLFDSNYKNMIEPLYRYSELYHKRESFKDLEEFAKALNYDELLDLEVLFILSWCGTYLRENNRVVKELLEKGSGFSQDDKTTLFVELHSFIGTILPYYKTLLEQNLISVSTTPFYHPILPLLLNKESALEADIQTKMPNFFYHFELDALEQIRSGIEYYKWIFDRNPTGFWPSEGSVSEQTLVELSKAGVKWVCTDEDIIYKSLGRSELNLYKKYLFKKDNHSIKMAFRNKRLSDLIGFTYSNLSAKEAVADFINRLKSIYDSLSIAPNLFIFLDGENAWEYYPNNAKDFFIELYSQLNSLPWCELTTLDEMFVDDNLESEIGTIKAGSWIYGTFSTWIGQEQKNRAWELLSKTKKFVDENLAIFSNEQLAKIKKELLVAEGSDWFWWYGDDHFTPLAEDFDYLFRKHLINIYTIANLEAPPYLFDPIVTKTQKIVNREPKNFITPLIDGRYSNFFEWLGSGFINLKDSSSMDSSGFIFSSLHYGYDEDSIYFALEGRLIEIINKGFTLKINLISSKGLEVLIPILADNQVTSKDIKYAIKDILEIKIVRNLFLSAEKKFNVVFELHKDGAIVERYPIYSEIEINLESQFLQNWFI